MVLGAPFRSTGKSKSLGSDPLNTVLLHSTQPYMSLPMMYSEQVQSFQHILAVILWLIMWWPDDCLSDSLRRLEQVPSPLSNVSTRALRCIDSPAQSSQPSSSTADPPFRQPPTSARSLALRAKTCVARRRGRLAESARLRAGRVPPQVARNQRSNHDPTDPRSVTTFRQKARGLMLAYLSCCFFSDQKYVRAVFYPANCGLSSGRI